MFLGLKFLILWTLIRQTVGFLPSEENTNGRSEQTHSSITHDAIYRAAADVIAHVVDPEEHRSGSVDEILREYLGNTLGCFRQTVEKIKNKNSLAQREYGAEASRTMHCDQIEPGHLLLQSLRDSIINQSQNAKPNWDLVRDLIGQYLFTLQEFYSNTNWVEMFGSRVCQELGISGNPLPFKVPTEITSKYQGFLTNKDRLWNKKCSTYLGTRIERGQSAPSSQSSAELSLEVHNHHQVAAVAATKASVAFLIRNDTGLLPILGIDKFTELLGLNSKSPCMTPGLLTALVIDDQVSLDRTMRDIAKPLGKRRNRRSGGFDLFAQIAAATGGKIVHTSASSLGGILGEFVKNNMGVTTLQVASFEITSESQHKMSVDPDLTLLTIRIEGGFSSTTKFSLYRPDGTKQVFSGNASVDLIGRTTVISVQNPSAGEWILNKKSSGTWNVKVGGSGNIDFTYKFMEDVDGIKFPFTGTSPITGTTMILSVTITGLPPAASVSSIILKTPDGAILRSLPVNDTSNDPTRVLYTKFDVTPQEFLISINGSLDSTIFTREKSEVITPVAASIEFASKPEKLILGKSAAILVNVTNTGSVDQIFRVTTVSDPVGFVTRASRTEFISAHSSKFVNITISAPSKTSASLTVKLSSRGTTLQTIKRTLQVADSEPPEIRTVNKSGNCAPDTMNYYNCSRQSWTCTMDIVFSANMKKLFVVPHNVNHTYSHNSSAPNIYTAKLSGTCCSYRPLVTAIDGRGNTRTTTLDFSGGVFFNTTVDDFDHLVKSSEMESAPAVADASLVYGLIGGVLGGLVVTAAILTSLIYYNKSRKRALRKNYLESLPHLCFEIQSQSVDRNSKPAFVMKN